MVQEIIAQKGIEAGDGLKSYISSFKDGIVPRAGWSRNWS